MNLLTLETTCDETAAAIIREDLSVVASVVASQTALHETFGGVVPEMASRAHVERIVPVVQETLQRAGLTFSEIDAVAVANTPGLAGSLLVGVSAAKALALGLGVPLVAINHLQGHIYACRVTFGPEVFPCVGLIVSGGHTNLYRCGDPTEFELLGATIDDAAGEAFDKVAALLGLPYPGGPSIERAARNGNAQRYAFPRSFLHDDRLDFSFSGLKTAVRYQVTPPARHDNPNPEPLSLDDATVADIAASFQQAVVDVLVAKSLQAVRQEKLKTLCVGGGVAANQTFRTALEKAAARRGVKVYVAPLELCTDNAVLGAIAWERLKAGEADSLDLNIFPGLVRKPKNS
jgi:N6-L-threonylcarbamoyladenine synthase